MSQKTETFVKIGDDVDTLEGTKREDGSTTRMHLEVGSWEGYRSS
jgi:hypothetical protein